MNVSAFFWIAFVNFVCGGVNIAAYAYGGQKPMRLLFGWVYTVAGVLWLGLECAA